MKLNSPQATILASVIAVLGIVVGAFLNPFATKLINQPTPTPNTTSLAIEQIPFTLETYDGEDDVDRAGKADFSFINNENLIPEYLLHYALPNNDSKWSYAGMEFEFLESQNLSSYKYIEFTISYVDRATEVAVKILDITQTSQLSYFSGNAQSENPIVIPLGNFDTINFNAVYSIGFEVDKEIAYGTDGIIIKNLWFTK